MWLHSRIILGNKTIAVAMLLAWAVFGAGIAGAETLYELGDRVEVETDGGIDEHVIAIAPETITPTTRDLRFELSNGVVVAATITSAEHRGREGDNVVWRGSVGGAEGHRVTLTRIGSTVEGYFESDIGPHLIRSAGKSHRLVWIDTGLFGDCGTEHEPNADSVGGSTLAPDYSGQDYVGGNGDGNLIDIDVLGLYTWSARQQAGGTSAIEARLQSAIDVGNTALIDSLSRMRFRLVHTAQFEHDDSGQASLDISNLMASPQVAALRDQVGADLVGLVVGQLESGLCGLASGVLTNPGGNAGLAHQVTELSCAIGNFTYAHELGHLVGMNHDPGQVEPTQAIYPWAFGHFDPVVGFRTVMSRAATCQSCTRVGHFSNPDVSEVGAPTGIADERDNTRTADLVAPVIAAYRTAPSLPSGALDVANCSTIAGWARDVDNTQPIRVRIVHEGEVLATVVADDHRGDLPFPDQNHGFSIPTPLELSTGELETVHVFALDVNAQGQETGSTVALDGSPKTLMCGSSPRFVASYIPFEGGPRTELALTTPSSPLFDFHYAQWLGNFEQRPGGACHQGQNNPTYLKVRYEGPDIVSCSYQASWDSGPNTCSAGIIGYLNAQNEFVVNTDFLATNPQTCSGYDPPIVHLPFNQPAWLQLDFTTTEGTTHSRRLNFLKFREIPIPD